MFRTLQFLATVLNHLRSITAKQVKLNMSLKTWFLTLSLICLCRLSQAQDQTSAPKASAGPSAASQLQGYVDRGELAGAVTIVADKSQVLSVGTVGFADISTGKAMKEDSVFWIASQTKGMTAVAVMMLVDEGKISLNDPVQKYLPEFNSQMVVAEKDNDHVVLRKPSHPITIREVLCHVSGMPFKSAMEEPTLDGLPLAKAVRSYAMTPLETEPGSRYQYSNAGINSAARVLEVVSGMKYEDFMQKRLFDPLGMTDTTFWLSEEQLSRLAKSYRPNKENTNLEEFGLGQLTSPLTDHNQRFPMPAGGLFSTARDTAIFCQMLLNDGQWNGRRYLSESSMSELRKNQTPESVKSSYSLGFSVGSDWLGHGGAHATNMEVHFSKGLVLIWMVQHGGYPGQGKDAQGVFKRWAFESFGKPL